MQLTGLHILLTYTCTFECDHCFVWGSPHQNGVFTLGQIRQVLGAARDTGTVEWIYYEGGEPFLYYPILLEAAKLAHEMGFQVGIVTNAYWASSTEDAGHWLAPFSGLVQDLTASSDLFHYNEMLSLQVQRATRSRQPAWHSDGSDQHCPARRYRMSGPQRAASGGGIGGHVPRPRRRKIILTGQAAPLVAIHPLPA